MIIKSLKDTAGITAGDVSFLRELLHPAKGPLDIGYAEIGEGQVVYVPPGEIQFIENPGPRPLAFLCIVDPAWTGGDEEIL